MKLYKVLTLGLGAAMALTSCNDWLDVNDNPNSPTDALATYEKRLPHIQFYTRDAYLFGTQITEAQVGNLTASTNNGVGSYASWACTEARTTTCYQWWFVGAACNLTGLYQSAAKVNATHYMGAAYLLRAYGMGLMMDLHGEMPYEEALSEAIIPVYNTGSEMFELTIKDIDAGLELLAQPQGADALPLAVGDGWGGGDVNKWIKFGNLLKARNLLHLYKKGNGKAEDLKYDPEAILACLDKSFKSVDENMVIYHEDKNGQTHDNLGWGEPVDYNGLYSVLGMNSNYFSTKSIFDMLTNFDGCGIEDPRADRLLPWVYSGKSATSPEEVAGQKIKWNGNWRRTVGVDLSTNIRTTGTPHATLWDAANQNYYTDKHQYDEDTVYVQQRCGGTGYYGGQTLMVYLNGVKGTAGNTAAFSGVFNTRPTSPTYMGSYHEVCFIRAEVLFNLGRKAEAYEAYKAGVKAHMQAMNIMLKKWSNNPKEVSDCPSFVPMTDAEIDNYCNTALGTAGELTLGKIMTQKHIAMMYSVEAWSDMRRYDYDENIFIGYKIPAERLTNTSAKEQFPNASDRPRRWKVSSHEYDYNTDNLKEIGKYLPGGRSTDGTQTWWDEKTMWSVPVWWDCADAPKAGPLNPGVPEGQLSYKDRGPKEFK